MQYRTDLAAEDALTYGEKGLAGLSQQDEAFGKLGLNTVYITDGQTAKLVGKPEGEYVTVTTPPFSSSEEITEEEITVIAGRISNMLPKEGLVLVVGLGNSDITPDAIGPRTARKILATRHLSGEIKKQAGLEKLRDVAVIAPGVLGQTGIETSEIIAAVAGDVSPCAVIVIDALAARSVSRLGNTIQIANTGISPGSGVMNRRKELSAETLGTPVISIGIPTVVDATTLASDLLDSSEEDFDKRRELFEPQGEAMMITPREIDQLIDHACKTLSLAINHALQPGLTFEEINYLAG